MRIKTKNTLLSAAIITVIGFSGQSYAASIDQLGVNKYDCSVEEVKNYMMKRTSSIRKETGIATWDDFKENAVLITTSANGGAVPENAYAGTDTPGGVNAEEGGGGLFSDCPVFSSDFEMSEINLDFDFNFTLPNFTDALQQAIAAARAAIEEELSKGICERIDFEELQATMNEKRSDYYESFKSDALDAAGDAIDNRLEQQTGADLDNWTGYDLEDFDEMEGGDLEEAHVEHNIVNNALDDSMGSTGKLINVFDSRIDDKRERTRDNEVDRQKDELTKRILGTD